MLKLKLLNHTSDEMWWVDTLKNMFSLPFDMFNATMDWISGKDKDGEIFYVTLNDDIIGITGWYSIKCSNTQNMFGMRWHGILPSHRGNGYGKKAIDLLYSHLMKKYNNVKLYEIASNTKTAEYFIKNNFINVSDENVIRSVLDCGGEIGECIVLEYNINNIPIDMLFNTIQEIYNITIYRDYENYDGEVLNCGCCSDDEIYLSRFDDESLEISAMFHELGHVESTNRDIFFERSHFVSTLSKEGMAWEVGFGLAAKHGFVWGYSSKQYQYARKCLATYVGGEYDDVTVLNEYMKEHTLTYRLEKRIKEARGEK